MRFFRKIDVTKLPLGEIEEILEKYDRVPINTFAKFLEMTAPIVITILALVYSTQSWLLAALLAIGSSLVIYLGITSVRKYRYRGYRRDFFVLARNYHNQFLNLYYRDQASRNLTQHKISSVREGIRSRAKYSKKLDLAFNYEDRIPYILGQLVNYYERDSKDNANYRVSIMKVEGNELKIARYVYPRGIECQTKKEIAKGKLKLTKKIGCCGKAWDEGRVVIIEDTDEDLGKDEAYRTFELFHKNQQFNIKSICCIPVFDERDRVTSIVNIDCNKPKRFSGNISTLLGGISETEDEISIFLKFITLTKAFNTLKHQFKA